MLVTSLTLFIDHVADLDEGRLLFIIAETISRNVGKDYLPDPFRLQVVMDLVGDVRDAGPGVEQDGGMNGCLCLKEAAWSPVLKLLTRCSARVWPTMMNLCSTLVWRSMREGRGARGTLTFGTWWV